MGVNYYSQTKIDGRMQVFSTKPFSFLELVGNEEIRGTTRHMRKYIH